MAGRDNGFTAKDRRKIVLAAAEATAPPCGEFAEQTLLEVWYAHLDIEQAIGPFRVADEEEEVQGRQGAARQGPHRDSTKAQRKLTDGGRRASSGSSATRR